MANFISTDRLDYLCEADVFIRKEFDRLKKINELYRYQTAEFLIKNNFHKHLLQHKNLSLAVVRIYFSGIWEWHIREEIVQIINDIEKEHFGTRKPDCMWMLKSKESASTPVYYCDAAFFWHHEARNENWCEKLCDLPEKLEFVSKVEILLQSKASKYDKNSILKLCRPHQNSSLLQCEFSNNIF